MGKTKNKKAKKANKAAPASRIREALMSIEGTFLLLEQPEMDAAILGLVSGAGNSEPVVCYDRAKVISIFVKQGMSYEEAEEFFEFNVIGAYLGPQTPMFLESTKSLLCAG